MGLFSIAELFYILALLLNFVISLFVTYILIQGFEKTYFVLLLGITSLLFGLHHIAEISKDLVYIGYAAEALEPVTALLFLLAVLQNRKHLTNR